jgi:hypothetical protein
MIHQEAHTQQLPLSPLLLPPSVLPPPLPPLATRPKNTTATGAKVLRAKQTMTMRRTVVAVVGLQRSCSVPFSSGYRDVQPGMEEEAAALVAAMVAACLRKSWPVCNRTAS